MPKQLELFVAKTCLCLLGNQGQPEGHDGPCAWLCATCMDDFACDRCKADLIFEACGEPQWNEQFGRPMATMRRTAPGILERDGWSARPDTVAVLTPWRGRAGYRLCMSYVQSAPPEFRAYATSGREG